MLKKNKKNFVIAIALIAVMALGGVAAYFTSTDDATNVWTVGKIKIDLLEDNYDATDDAERKNILPNSEFAKDPRVVNEGINDAFVFIKFWMPKDQVIVANQDGTRQANQLQELFDYGINDGWTLVESDTTGEDMNMYVYAYGTDNACTALPANETTTVLFKNADGAHIESAGEVGVITFKNVIEGQGLETSTLQIPIEAYAIQTTDITTANTTNPADVWEVLYNQTNPTTVDDLTNYFDFDGENNVPN